MVTKQAKIKHRKKPPMSLSRVCGYFCSKFQIESVDPTFIPMNNRKLWIEIRYNDGIETSSTVEFVSVYVLYIPLSTVFHLYTRANTIVYANISNSSGKSLFHQTMAVIRVYLKISFISLIHFIKLMELIRWFFLSFRKSKWIAWICGK